jgi:hypothetical protein
MQTRWDQIATNIDVMFNPITAIDDPMRHAKVATIIPWRET